MTCKDCLFCQEKEGIGAYCDWYGFTLNHIEPICEYYKEVKE